MSRGGECFGEHGAMQDTTARTTVTTIHISSYMSSRGGGGSAGTRGADSGSTRGLVGSSRGC